MNIRGCRLKQRKGGQIVFRLKKQYSMTWTMTCTRLRYKGCDHLIPPKFSLSYSRCTLLHSVSILKRARFLSKCACSAARVQNFYIMSEFGPYLWKSLLFWQMGAIIKAWTSPMLNPKKVRVFAQVCDDWLSLIGGWDPDVWCVCYWSERGHCSSHMWVYYVSHTPKV